MKKKSLVLLLGLGLLACNKTSSGIPAVGPLSAEQKARLQATADALADATQFKAKAMSAQRLAPQAPVAEKRTQVLKAIDEQCQIGPETVAVPTPQPKVSIVKMRVASRSKNNDGACPIDFSWETTTTNKLDDNAGVVSGRVDLILHYAPANADAKAAFNAQSYDFTAFIDSTVKDKTVTYTGSGRGTATVFVNGAWQSVSLSSVTIGTVSDGNTNFNYSYNVVYRDGVFVEMRLVLAQSAGQAKLMTCTINGVPVDQKEFMSYLSKLGFETRLPSQLKD